MKAKSSKPNKSLMTKLNPQKQILTLEQLIEYETFRLTTTQKTIREIQQFNDLYDIVIEDIQNQIQLTNGENQELQRALNENEKLYGSISSTQIMTDQLFQQMSSILEVMQKNKVKSLQLKTQYAQLEKKEKLLNKRIQIQQTLKLESQNRIKQKQQLVKQMRIEGQWQEREIERLYKILNSSQIQNQELFTLKKKLNNQLQQLKGNIRVYCRIRPSKNETSSVLVTSDNSLKLTYEVDRVKSQPENYEKGFIFQQIFDTKDTQNKIFDELSQLIHNSVDGKNVCIFAYGQTGSGKTFTLLGPSEEQVSSQVAYQQRGLAQRSIELIFKLIKQSEKFSWNYKVFLSIQEIYLESIIDLGPKQGQYEMRDSASILAMIKQALCHRKVGSTNMNERSSRSHLIITTRLQGIKEKTNEIRKGSLVFVDLAGSQRLKQSKVEGDMLKQTQFINKSLSSLGNVINEMRKNSEHIPFRNSKLTFTLQKYLKGQSKTLMFVNISPDPQDVFQTKLALKFAEGVSQCKVKK